MATMGTRGNSSAKDTPVGADVPATVFAPASEQMPVLPSTHGPTVRPRKFGLQRSLQHDPRLSTAGIAGMPVGSTAVAADIDVRVRLAALEREAVTFAACSRHVLALSARLEAAESRIAALSQGSMSDPVAAFALAFFRFGGSPTIAEVSVGGLEQWTLRVRYLVTRSPVVA